MAKLAPGSFALQKRKHLLLLLSAVFLTTTAFFCFRGTLDTFDCRRDNIVSLTAVDSARLLAPVGNVENNPLDFMRFKLVLLVSHELSFSLRDCWLEWQMAGVGFLPFVVAWFIWMERNDAKFNNQRACSKAVTRNCLSFILKAIRYKNLTNIYREDVVSPPNTCKITCYLESSSTWLG